MQTGLFPPKANICNVYNNNIWINALILQHVKENNTMRKLCKTLKIKQQCISVSHICCWWIAQVAYCLCIGCQWWIPWQNWVIENGTNVTNSSYAWKETWSIIFNNLNTNRCQPRTKIRWTKNFRNCTYVMWVETSGYESRFYGCILDAWCYNQEPLIWFLVFPHVFCPPGRVILEILDLSQCFLPTP